MPAVSGTAGFSAFFSWGGCFSGSFFRSGVCGCEQLQRLLATLLTPPSAGTRSGAAYVAGTSPPPPALRLVTGNNSAVPSAVAGAQHETLVS